MYKKKTLDSFKFHYSPNAITWDLTSSVEITNHDRNKRKNEHFDDLFILLKWSSISKLKSQLLYVLFSWSLSLINCDWILLIHVLITEQRERVFMLRLRFSFCVMPLSCIFIVHEYNGIRTLNLEWIDLELMHFSLLLLLWVSIQCFLCVPYMLTLIIYVMFSFWQIL